MLKELFTTQQKIIDDFFKNIDVGDAERILVAIEECKGSLIFTGVGKSGLIAKTLANTYLSLGKRAHYLSPLDALHGDIAAVNQGDLVIFLSKGGGSEELLRLLPFVQERRAKTMAWVCRSPSALMDRSDFPIYLPLSKELCPFDLAPTSSSAIQLTFGNILAVAYMQRRSFSRGDYLMNHPAGQIGAKLSLKVEDLMLKGESLPIAKEDDLLLTAIIELTNKKCGCLLIVNEGEEVQGVFTDGDLRRALQQYQVDVLHLPMKELMNHTFISLDKKQLVVDAIKHMQTSRLVKEAPVVENNKLIGLIRMHDIVARGIG
ncbi:MAG: KpsF/GutQ family sugar-phosphate isomerase [Simkaniaceae bacterium]|nr:KpsF/GutQ family sugar-phosphate isomerase [Simkaniaceae bacterium]